MKLLSYVRGRPGLTSCLMFLLYQAMVGFGFELKNLPDAGLLRMTKLEFLYVSNSEGVGLSL